MHPCLAIPELVENIVSQVGNDGKGSESNSGPLAALARTARVFQEPALAALWRTQTSVLNLLRCMPSDLFQEQIVAGTLVSFTLRRAILASDWKHIHPYALRVKEFVAHSSDGLSSGNIFAILSLSLPHDYIYPNLTHLTWYDHEDDIPLIRPLLGPNITHITIGCSAPSHLSFLSLLPSKCPLLEDVTFHLPDREAMTTETWSSNGRSLFDFIEELHCITHLQLDIIDMVVLKHMGRLPYLKVLHAEGLPDALLTSQITEKGLFPSLRHLSIESSNMSLVTRFVALCSDATFESLTVDCASYASPTSVKRLLTVLEPHWSSFTDLEIKSSVVGSETDDPGFNDVFSIDYLYPALRLENLQYLDLRLTSKLDIDDLAVTQMAEAWSHLHTLAITGAHSSDHGPGQAPTLRSLRTLAFHCPALTQLEMTLDTTGDIPAFDPESEPPRPNESLRSLKLGSSPIATRSTSQQIAHFISAIFPNLRSVTTAFDVDAVLPSGSPEPALAQAQQGDQDSRSRWREVRWLLPILVEVRAEERRWAKRDA